LRIRYSTNDFSSLRAHDLDPLRLFGYCVALPDRLLRFSSRNPPAKEWS
jgi:hypothetical protein